MASQTPCYQIESQVQCIHGLLLFELLFSEVL